MNYYRQTLLLITFLVLSACPRAGSINKGVKNFDLLEIDTTYSNEDGQRLSIKIFNDSMLYYHFSSMNYSVHGKGPFRKVSNQVLFFPSWLKTIQLCKKHSKQAGTIIQVYDKEVLNYFSNTRVKLEGKNTFQVIDKEQVNLGISGDVELIFNNTEKKQSELLDTFSFNSNLTAACLSVEAVVDTIELTLLDEKIHLTDEVGGLYLFSPNDKAHHSAPVPQYYGTEY